MRHQLAYSKHCRDSGHGLEKKQSATWSKQEDTALPQPVLSPKTGRGLEHHFPQAYSQAGADTTEVQVVAEVTFVVSVLNVVSEADELVNFDVMILLLDVELDLELVACDGALETELLVKDETDVV